LGIGIRIRIRIRIGLEKAGARRGGKGREAKRQPTEVNDPGRRRLP